MKTSSPSISKLTAAQMEVISTVIPDAFDIEFQRIVVPSVAERLMNFFYGFYLEGDPFAFTTPKYLLSLTDSIFSDITVRKFILNYTDRVMVFLSTDEIEYESIVETLALGLTKNKLPQVEARYCMVPEHVAASMSADLQEVKGILSNNAWIVVVLYLHLFMHKTMFFKNIQDKQSL